MVRYVRRRFRRRARRGRKRFRAGRQSFRRRIARAMYRTLRPETRLLTTYLAASGVSTSGAVLSLTDIAQGTDINARIGNRIKIRKVYVRGRLVAAGTDLYNVMRIIVFRTDKFLTAGAPTMASLLDSSAASYLYALRNVQNSSELKVMYDKTMYIVHPTSANPNSGPNAKMFKIVKTVNRSAHWTSSTATSYDYGQVWMAVISDSVVASHPTIEFEARVFYTDI